MSDGKKKKKKPPTLLDALLQLAEQRASASEYVKFGDYTLVRTSDDYVVAWVAPCSSAIYFCEYEDAVKVKTDIEFHLITCEKCHP